ncbi:MAG: hypothetical protein MJY56_05935 [Bacteroidales bacterium]|nr:hypothetical protein [Bacteroidales bacterium]
MKRKLFFTATALVFFAALSAGAQNIDPTVTVTNDYKGSVGENDKPVPEMFVPDSVTKFNIQFDYTINPKTYSGSYEFNPYLLDLKPNPTESRARKVYVKAGAGYSLRPTFTAVWSPSFKKFHNLKMNVYANHDSYVGKYRSIGYVLDPESKKFGKIADTGADKYKGYDLVTRVGLDGRVDFTQSYLAFDAGYYVLHTKTDSLAKGYNAAKFYLKYASKERPLYNLIWDAELRYNVGRHELDHVADGFNSFNEHDFTLKACVGAGVERRVKTLLDVDLNLTGYSGLIHPDDEGMSGLYAGNIAFTPRATFRDDIWDISAGIRFDIPLAPFDGYINLTRGQYAYPDIRVALTAIPKYLGVYMNILGGVNSNPYSERLGSNHFLSYKSRIGDYLLLDNTVEKVNAALGFRGQIAYRFRYDLSVGYAKYASSPLDAFAVYTPAIGADGFLTAYDGFTRGMLNCPYSMYYIDFKWGVNVKPVEVDGFIRWQDSDILKSGLKAFEPARFSAGARAEYNWRHRIFAGLMLEGAIARRGYLTTMTEDYVLSAIPGYVNLSVDARYRINPKLTVWLEGSNLCNQVIQRTAFYAERGIDVRAGITLSF